MRKICPVANFHLFLNMIVYLIIEKMLSQKNIYVSTELLFYFLKDKEGNNEIFYDESAVNLTKNYQENIYAGVAKY